MVKRRFLIANVLAGKRTVRRVVDMFPARYAMSGTGMWTARCRQSQGRRKRHHRHVAVNQTGQQESARLERRPSFWYNYIQDNFVSSLRTGWSGEWIPSEARFSAPVQPYPGAHPASYTMSTGSFPGVKRPGRGVDHPPPSRAEFEGRVEIYVRSSSGPSWPVLGWTLPLPLYVNTSLQFSCDLQIDTAAQDDVDVPLQAVSG